MDATVEQGVQMHAELCSNGSSKPRCVLNHRGFCRVGFFGGMRRGHGRVRLRPTQDQVSSQTGKDF